MPEECQQNTDPNKLVREGSSQDQRMPTALDPSYAPVDERTLADKVVFAQSYAAFLKYFDASNTAVGDWRPFFGKDVSVQLALVAIEDIEAYKTTMKSWFDYLNNRENIDDSEGLKNKLGFLFAGLGTLAQQLDAFKENLPVEIPLKGKLQNLIKSQLAPALKRLIAYYKAGVKENQGLDLIDVEARQSSVLILRSQVAAFDSVLNAGLSMDWSMGVAWSSYKDSIRPEESVYGDSSNDPTMSEEEKVFIQINHCSTHALFKSIFDQFLKVFARTISEANSALEEVLMTWDNHQPHYALFLAFLRLFEYARTKANTLTGRHLDFYYREILRLKEKPAEPGHVHLLAELAKQADIHEFKAGELFRAGKDDQGKDLFFANDRDFVANKATVAALKTVYRHGNEIVGNELAGTARTTTIHQGRIYASPIANSDDGQGAELTSTGQSGHPFFNKVYADGRLQSINMPKAEIGFAIASHYLLMAEGKRTITIRFMTSYLVAFNKNGESGENKIVCMLTTEQGWLTIITPFISFNQFLELNITLTGDAPSITPYSVKTHGYNFETDLPLLLVKLKQDDTREYAYSVLQGVVVNKITLTIVVEGLKSLGVSNDFGPVDTSKPFQPFGPSPVAGSSLIIGSKEVFQKKLSNPSVTLKWLSKPSPYVNTSTPSTKVYVDFLSNGDWQGTKETPYTDGPIVFSVSTSVTDEPDFSANEFYRTSSRNGFVRLRLTDGFGQDKYQADLLKYLNKEKDSSGDVIINNLPLPPVVPIASEISMKYKAETTIILDSSVPNSFETRKARFFHVGPFGTAEQHPYLNSSGSVPLLPQFNFPPEDIMTPTSDAGEFYIGINGLKLPQNLSLLFQVVDGTANPKLDNPEIHWSYLKNNNWIGFAEKAVEDGTGGLLSSGIITFAVPREATDTNTILPKGMIWIRAAVDKNSDAVCKLKMVAAQAFQATFVDKGNAPSFPATPLAAGAISKLVQPAAAVKTIIQPFESFGGRGAEQPMAFNARISERLRHKDRAIALWDYERVILEAFPQVYKVKCLNHTYYEADGYRESAPGHITVVTIPNLQFHNLRDPLKPFTSLGLIEEIKVFLKKRMSCFTKLHVMNPEFEEVKLSFNVRFYDGGDETYRVQMLKHSITRFLSPWAFADGGSPSFGGKIYKSVLINFIEEQPYVDYVTDFRLFRDINDVKSKIDLSEVEGSRAISVLVSAPLDKHEITLI